MQSYLTIGGTVDTELEIQRSRFLTRLVRVETEEAARDVIAEVRAQHPKARHHCTAFVLGDRAQVQRSSDDGEPSGTAGAPMLEALTAAGLSDTVAVVTRYFGGILLGAGGLTRAYRAAVAQATEAASLVRRELRVPVVVETRYDLAPLIEAEARRREYVVGDAEYTDSVAQEFLVYPREVGDLVALAAEVSSGSAAVTEGEATFVDVRVSF